MPSKHSLYSHLEKAVNFNNVDCVVYVTAVTFEPAARAAQDYFGFDDAVANGKDVRIRTPEDKKNATERHA